MIKIALTFAPVMAFVALALIFRNELPAWLLVTAVVVGIAPLILDVAKTLRQKRIDLGLPVIITIVILLVLGKYPSAAIFVLIILAGRLFKEYILWRVRRSVASISEALPDLALLKQGAELKEVHISAIKKGDTLAVKGGGRIPVDGILLSESASLDESVITGESKAVAKRQGAHLVAASICLSAYIELEAQDTSANSTIAQMQKLVEDAQARNAPLSRFTTRYAEGTSIAALALVGVVYALNRNIDQALALWIALVPVIFAIIVPVATTIGISLLARSGVLVKTAEALENLTQVNTLCFDKTGTLTRGQPEISGILPLGGTTEESLLQITASIERFSEHHLGEPIVQEAKLRKLPWLEVKEINVVKGRGISARVDAQEVLVGNREYLREANIPIAASEASEAEAQEENGATAIWVARGHAAIGLIFLSDQPRPETKSTLSRLRALGYSLVMLTGDHPKVAQKIGTNIGVTEIKAGLLPQDKISAITDFKKAGQHVLMVGDGINDAPALAEANVGVAMGLKGVGITLESAQVVLIHDNLEMLPHVISVAKRTFKVVRLDLVIATGIHLLAAALVLCNVIGLLGSTVFHQVSSVLVLLNTARLFSIQKGAASPSMGHSAQPFRDLEPD